MRVFGCALWLHKAEAARSEKKNGKLSRQRSSSGLATVAYAMVREVWLEENMWGGRTEQLLPKGEQGGRWCLLKYFLSASRVRLPQANKKTQQANQRAGTAHTGLLDAP